jgi:hypothetical protein
MGGFQHDEVLDPVWIYDWYVLFFVLDPGAKHSASFLHSTTKAYSTHPEAKTPRQWGCSAFDGTWPCTFVSKFFLFVWCAEVLYVFFCLFCRYVPGSAGVMYHCGGSSSRWGGKGLGEGVLALALHHRVAAGTPPMTELKPMTHARAQFAGTTVGGCLFSSCFCVHPSHPRVDCVVDAEKNDVRLYVVGGSGYPVSARDGAKYFYESANGLSAVEFYSRNSGTWTQAPPLLERRHFHQVTTLY